MTLGTFDSHLFIYYRKRNQQVINWLTNSPATQHTPEHSNFSCPVRSGWIISLLTHATVINRSRELTADNSRFKWVKSALRLVIFCSDFRLSIFTSLNISQMISDNSDRLIYITTIAITVIIALRHAQRMPKAFYIYFAADLHFFYRNSLIF